MLSSTGYLNDGSSSPPSLRVFLNLDNLVDLRRDSLWPGLDGVARYERLAEDGFEGVQFTVTEPDRHCALPFCGLDRVNVPGEADGIVERHAQRGDLCLTLHVGWGLEDDAECNRLVEAILAASQKYRLPVFFETHRATITQDLWRTVELTRRFPAMRFNGDFSHYYCGLELVYGDWRQKLEFMKPIFERTGFLHGRIASPGAIQAALPCRIIDGEPRLESEPLYLTHFRELWTLALRGFLSTAVAGDVIVFAPELLSSEHDYARTCITGSGREEESDRYAQALLYKCIIGECFREAQRPAS